ncbi:MAG: hypothetical protein AAB467_05215, partial [Patescibacteria group bacterium]
IQTGLESDDLAVQRAYVTAIWCAPDAYQEKLLELARKKLGNKLVDPPLYDNKISNSSFQREKFNKTGSETTILGGQLKDKTIIRHLKPDAFLAWQKLYEDYPMWQNEGFDYVPIEPIQSYHLNKKGLVDVYSGVLDLSLDAWKKMGGKFSAALKDDVHKIRTIVHRERIEHGHMHSANFCLRFFRDADGNVDFDRKPRIYLIDFDMAISK